MFNESGISQGLKMNKNSDRAIGIDNEQGDISTSGRREALAKLGKYAYAAPVVTALLLSDKATAGSHAPSLAPPPRPNPNGGFE